MASTYDIGDTVRLRATYTSTSGVAANPTTVVFLYLDPSGNTTTLTSASTSVPNPSVGEFHTDVILDEAGLWQYRVSSTGAIVTSEESYFIVRDRRVP
jgi:hypothetical protein